MPRESHSSNQAEAGAATSKPKLVFRYKTATAFQNAIKAKIANAAASSPHSIAELRRQFAYDRLLARVFISDPESWVLKGAAGLLARIPTRARHSMDVDLYFQGSVEAIVEGLVEAAEVDLGDYFTFDIELAHKIAGHNSGIQVKITAYIGDVMFVGFRVDTVIATNMTGTPESVPALCPINVDGLRTSVYRTYPVVDHIADKHAAMIATYGDGVPSTRYRDLVDLVLIAATQSINAKALHNALMSEYQHRNLCPPAEVTLPSPDWVDGYAAAARQAPNFAYPTAQAGLKIVKAMLDPILAGRTSGEWNPRTLEWV
ncbi:nucleotidyl transferase AbiEii/AbiGii toxin family protein [Candidatus Poriferisocius sp.]|uniref:nucleotidyl transferase AbiEii/AbiGii toxin family protein n=1 Tax=Candidatus Poriferisocius sp. TaxID=3101276 RepID=UPI003B02DF81